MSKRRSEDNGVDTPSKRISTETISSISGGGSTETEKILKELSTLVPVEKFNYKVPPVVMKHMLYSQIPDRTRVDREIDQLRLKGTIRIFKLGEEQESHAILFKDCYRDTVRKMCSDSPVVRKFLRSLIEEVRDISVDKVTLTKLGFTEVDVRELVQESLLNLRSTSSYWFSFPGAGKFMKPYIQGRNAVLCIIKKCKYKQILQPELESRKMKKSVPLGLNYHIHDIIGSDKVSVMETTCGPMLKLL